MKRFLLFLIIVFIAYMTAFYTTGKENGYDEMFDLGHLFPESISDYDVDLGNDHIKNGLEYIELELYDLALDEFFNAIYEDDNSENNYYVGYTYLLQEDYMSAVAYLTTAIELDSQNAKAYAKRGLAKYNQNYYDEAINDLYFSTELDPNVSEPYYHLSLCYEAKGDNHVALQSAETALKYDSTHVDSWFKAAYIAHELEQYETARDYYKQLLILDPDHRYANVNLGLCYSDMEQYDSAHMYYDITIAKFPEYALVYNNKGYIFQKTENYIEAIKWYSLSLEKDESYLNALWNRADCYFMLEKYQESIADYQAVYETNSEYYNSLYHIGECYEKLNDPVQAIVYFTKYKEQASTDSEYFEEVNKKIKNLI